MSNAMRFGKRSLAGVAAGALALGMLTIASAPAASAAPSIKPKASLTGTVSPVRTTFTGTTLQAVPFAAISWTSSTNIASTNDSVSVVLSNAPSPTAILGVGVPTLIGTATDPASATLGAGSADTLSSTQTSFAYGTAVTAGNTARVAIAASQAGTYSGTLTTNSANCATAVSGGATGGGICDSVAFTFTTTGSVASMTLTPASQTTSTSGTANVAVTLRDSAGNITQPLTVDTVTMASPGSAGITPITATSTGVSDTSLWDGVAVSQFTATTTPGTYAVTATPGGTLPSAGVTAQTATVTVSGTINTAAVTSIGLTVPTNAFQDTAAGGYNALTNAFWDVPVGTTAVTVQVAGTAGSTYRFSATTSAGGTVDGVGTGLQPVLKTVTIGAAGTGTMDFVIGGNATANLGELIVTQVGPTGTAIGSGGKVTVTQTLPTIDPATIYATPYGSVVATLGSTVNVSVLVTDQFENPVSNSQVRAYRTSTSGALLSTATTNASGTAALTVSGASGIASGTTESYVFQATTTAGGTVTGAGLTATLSVQYTTSGAVTAMTVQVAGGATTPILNTTTAIATRPFIQVPFGGTVNTPASGVYTVATGAGTATGNYVTFTPSASPANSVTVTVPEGVKVTQYDPASYTVRWNSSLASQSVTVASAQPVYVFATKTGDHDITFTSGAITATAKIRVATVPAAAYNIAVSPTTRTIEAGAFSTVTLTVSDVFGNPIPGVTSTAGAAGAVAGSATGEVLLSGLSSSGTFGTGASGTATVTLIAGKAGTGTVTFAPSGGTTNAAAAWQTGYVKPVGAPDPVTSASVAITITQDVNRSIVITGERTTVSGKPGIRVDGIADGFENGAKVKPWIRFPGETEYTAGSARPGVSDEEFTWQRKTGKKVYVYFTSEDDSIRSNRIIIAAN